VNTPAEVRKNCFVGEAGSLGISLGMFWLSASSLWPFSGPSLVADSGSPVLPWRVTACSVFVEGNALGTPNFVIVSGSYLKPTSKLPNSPCPEWKVEVG